MKIMRKIVSLLLAATILLGILLSAVSCGTDGQTPYIGENGNWWIGDTDLGVPATGPKGDQGEQGPQGEKGEEGNAGINGYAPFIGENGNWWIGDTDLRIPATGPKGDKGDQGNDGKTPYIGENGNWWINGKDLGVFAGGGTTPPPSVEPEGPAVIEAVKTSSHTKARTVHPGAKIKYFIIVSNVGEGKATLEIVDTIPAYTTYVEGDATRTDNTLTWNVNVPAGESITLEYTVKVDNNMDLCEQNAAIEATKAKVGDIEVAANPVYVEKTLNSVDIKYIDAAIDALSGSTWSHKTLAGWTYYVAFTRGNVVITDNIGADFGVTLNDLINGTGKKILTDMVVPTLFGGKNLTRIPSGLRGDACKSVSEMDLVPGDIIISQIDGKLDTFMYGSYGLFSMESGYNKVDAAEILNSLTARDYFFVLRPTMAMTGFTHSDPDLVPETLNERQKALVETAKYYILRGQWLQYDDTYLQYAQTDYTGNESRWQVATKTPEEYTQDLWGYINCAAFTHDVYWTVFGEKLPGGMYTTKNYAAAGSDMKIWSYTRTADQTHTDAEKERVSKDFLNTLQPGDTLIVRRKDGSSGHAMLYIGDGVFIHSTGGSYNFNGTVGTSTGIGVEAYDPTIRYCKVQDYFLDPASTNGYIFGPNVTETCVIRVLNNSGWASKPITKATQNRVEYLPGIIGQKLVSAGASVSVNPGDEITYTISMNNTNNYDVTLNVNDVVPENTTLVSAEGATVEGTKLSWKAEIPARTKVELTFTVKVNENTASGTVIKNDGATIAGVPFKTYDTVVKRTLTEVEQQKLIDAFNAIKTEGTTLNKLALVNEIYKRALGIENIFATTNLDEVMHSDADGVFTDKRYDNGELVPQVGSRQAYLLNKGSKYFDYVAGNLYGGRRLLTGSKLPSDVYNKRTRLARVNNLVIGDLYIGRTTSSTSVWIYLGGDNFYSISSSISLDSSTTVNSRLERGAGYAYYYAVLRPSYGIK